MPKAWVHAPKGLPAGQEQDLWPVGRMEDMHAHAVLTLCSPAQPRAVSCTDRAGTSRPLGPCWLPTEACQEATAMSK